MKPDSSALEVVGLTKRFDRLAVDGQILGDPAEGVAADSAREHRKDGEGQEGCYRDAISER